MPITWGRFLQWKWFPFRYAPADLLDKNYDCLYIACIYISDDFDRQGNTGLSASRPQCRFTSAWNMYIYLSFTYFQRNEHFK